jgi:hypothetical protein
MIFKFLVAFLPMGFVAKILGEVVHEVMGHGLFVVVFGGRITNINISLLWPYKLSSIGFSAPLGGFQPWQEVLVDGGGIIMCLVVSFILQLILLLNLSKKGNLLVSSMLFWLAFWTFINPAGYLVMGGIEPFGDITNLISAGVMTQQLAFILGLILFLVNLLSLSIILRNVLRKAEINEDAKWSIVLFWLIVPLLTLFSVAGLGQPLVIALLGFIPLLAAYIGLLLHNVILSRSKDSETTA